MDVNGDKVVSLEEMLQYFTVVASMCSEAEFAEIIAEMKCVADRTRASIGPRPFGSGLLPL